MRWQNENASGATLESDEVEFVVWMADGITRLRAQVAAALADYSSVRHAAKTLYDNGKVEDAAKIFLACDVNPDASAALDALLERAIKAALEEAARVCPDTIKNYDIMKPGKPDIYASREAQICAKGMVRIVEEDIRAIDPAAIVAKAKAPD